MTEGLKLAAKTFDRDVATLSWLRRMSHRHSDDRLPSGLTVGAAIAAVVCCFCRHHSRLTVSPRDRFRLDGDRLHHVHDRLDFEFEHGEHRGQPVDCANVVGLDDGVAPELSHTYQELVDAQSPGISHLENTERTRCCASS